MALPTSRPSDAATYEFIPEMWSKKIIDIVRRELVSINVVNTTWKEQLSKGDKVYIPVTTAMNTANVDPTSTATVSNPNTTTGTTAKTITIDYWKESTVQIDDMVKIQTQVSDLLNIMASNAAYALAKDVDTDVNGLFSSLGGYSTSAYGSDGQTFTDDIMIYLMETLDESDVPRKNRSLVIDPSVIADIYKIDKFVHLDYQKVAVIPSGNIGQIYGVPVYVTNNLTAVSSGTGNYGCLLHKDAIGLVIQQNLSVEKWRMPAAASDAIAVRSLWGCDELRDTFGIPFYTRKI